MMPVSASEAFWYDDGGPSGGECVAQCSAPPAEVVLKQTPHVSPTGEHDVSSWTVLRKVTFGDYISPESPTQYGQATYELFTHSS